MKLFTIISMSFLATTHLVAQSKSWISFYANSFELNATHQHDTVRIPMKLDPSIAFKDVKISYNRPIYVRLEKKYDKTYLDGFTLVPQNENAVPGIQIDADLSIIRSSGTYELYFAFSAPQKETQEFSFSIVRPASRLESQQTVHIVMEGQELKQQDPFVIKETGKLSAISQLQLPPPLFSGANKSDIVTFPSHSYTVSAGSVFHEKYTANKDEISNLPLGKTTGKMEINAPELISPLIVDFEIINKRSKWWIIGLVFLGVFCGAFVRHYVKNKKDLEEKKIEGFDLLEKIKREISVIEDKDFPNEIAGITRDLQIELERKLLPFQEEGSISKLSTLITDTANRYNDKKKLFEERIKSAKDKLDNLSLLFGYNNLSPAVRLNLHGAEDFYHSALNDLLKANATSAEKKIIFVISEINTFIDSYTKSILYLLSKIDDDGLFPFVTPQTLKDPIKEKSKEIKTSLDNVKQNPDDVKLLVTSVNAANSVQLNVSSVLAFLKQKIANLFEADFKNDGSPLMGKFRKDFEAWSSDLQNYIENPQDPIDLTSLASLNSSWKEVKNAKPAAETKLGNTGISTMNTLPWLQSMLDLRRANFIDIDYRSEPIEIGAQQARRSWFLFAAIQSIFLFLLIALAAYRFYAPTFLGTMDEMIAMFLFAFGLDITVDSVYQLRDKKP
jgi:hypothetical protein